jgi:DNA-binding LacI/PurR family transcriptional regulator
VELLHRLRQTGYDVGYSEKTLVGLGMKSERIIRHVESTEADAWIVTAGPRDLLRWFAAQRIPSFALFGRSDGLPIASIYPSKADPLEELIDRLFGLAHRRIVLLVREERRKPQPGLLERIFLDTLERRGIATSSYHLPDWDDSPGALEETLDSLFQHTPPTAILADEPAVFFAVMQKMGRLGLRVPEQVSLVCLDPTEMFGWCRPSVTHIAWDASRLVRRIEKWVYHVRIGKEDRRQSVLRAHLQLGGTIGPREGS